MTEAFVHITSSSSEQQAGAAVQTRVYRITSTYWRRHSANCSKRGRDALKCSCPLWGDGYIDSVRVLRKSLDTRSLDDAQTRLDGLIEYYIQQMYPESAATEAEKSSGQVEAPCVELPTATAGSSSIEFSLADPGLIANAIKAYLDNCVTNGNKPSTLRKYNNVMNQLKAFAESPKVRKMRVGDFAITDLDSYRASRRIALITSVKELETLRQFWDFCTVRGWCKVNIGRQIKTPRIVEQNEVVPYTKPEVKVIINACDTFGLYEYECKRAKGMVLILRFTALRISDIALMRRDRISRSGNTWRIFLRTTKNNAPVYLPVPDELVEALMSLPAPRGSDENCPFLFWNGKSKPKSMISQAERTLSAVFQKSGVQDAGAHRFRHTLATELLGKRASFEEVADILGNSPAIVRKHYAKWSKERQNRIDHLMKKVHGKAWNQGSGSNAKKIGKRAKGGS